MRKITLKRSARGTARQALPAESGFTLLELMIVLSMILILASIAAPAYRFVIIRARETVLKDDLFTMRKLIDQYTLDKSQPPESLEDLVQAGYLRGGLPVDPFTGSNQTWQADIEEVPTSPEDSISGVVDLDPARFRRSKRLSSPREFPPEIAAVRSLSPCTPPES